MSKDILTMEREAGLRNHIAFFSDSNVAVALHRFANLVRADEREACAKLVDDIEARCVAKDVDSPPMEHVSAAIREGSIT